MMSALRGRGVGPKAMVLISCVSITVMGRGVYKSESDYLTLSLFNMVPRQIKLTQACISYISLQVT